MSDIHRHVAHALPTGGEASSLVGSDNNHQHPSSHDMTEASSNGGALQLVLFSLFMFFGSYLAGSIPMYMPLNEEWLHLTSVMGAGLLLGTALAVIIPEGLQALIAGARESLKTSELRLGGADQDSDDQHAHQQEGAGHGHAHGGHNPEENIDKSIGMSLVLGFLFMLLIDQLASRRSGSSDPESGPATPNSSSRNRRKSTAWTTTLGLVVHAAADGIAMGAASSTHHTDIEMIVFLAIMLHKAPAAFGLTTFLMQDGGLEMSRIRKHLMTFALAAPLTGILTYILLSGSNTSMNTFHATGIAMLFSAGTFLYVATVHVLPEIMSKGTGGSNNGSSSPSGGHSHSHGSSFSVKELTALVGGALMPLILALGHHH